MRVVFYEDGGWSNLYPLTLLRPVFELRCGQFSQRERIVRLLPVTAWAVCMRPLLEPSFFARFPEAWTVDEKWCSGGPSLWVNGRWLPDGLGLKQLLTAQPDELGVIDETIVFFTVQPEEARVLDLRYPLDVIAALQGRRRATRAGGRLIHYPWDLVDANPRWLELDFRLRAATEGRGDHHRLCLPRQIDEALSADPPTARPPGGGLGDVSVMGRSDAVWIDPQAVVEPYVTIDVRSGPVWIDAGACVRSFTRLQGPCYVGRGTQLFRAEFREASAGPQCRLGGEIEASVIHGYANKYHAGFLGHAYVCPWVNLGALTTNSDLKNDYSAVRVVLPHGVVDTGMRKVGCFIGDHTKTGLGSLFNTGATVGVMAMVLPAGRLLPKHIPSFSRVWHGRLDDGLDLGAALETARTVMARRNVVMTPADAQLLRLCHRQTEEHRRRALQRQRDSERTAARRAG
ncbi:MAG: hypothetical protein D6725_13740 [Planctomycetota bacterium]|nr:MAG: hypothetical protein D6725_13740 [Planctomycetota bacterium]